MKDGDIIELLPILHGG